MTMYQNPSNPLMGGTSNNLGMDNTGLYTSTYMQPQQNNPMQSAYPGGGITPGGQQSQIYSPPSNFSTNGGMHTNVEVNRGGPWAGGQLPGGGVWGGNPINTPVMGAGPGTAPNPLPPGGGHWNGGPAVGGMQGSGHPMQQRSPWGGFLGGMGHMPSWPGANQAPQQWGSPGMDARQPMDNFQQPMFNMSGQGF